MLETRALDELLPDWKTRPDVPIKVRGGRQISRATLSVLTGGLRTAAGYPLRTVVSPPLPIPLLSRPDYPIRVIIEGLTHTALHRPLQRVADLLLRRL